MTEGDEAASRGTPQFGPVQMLVLGFADDAFTGRILPELRRLKELDVVRLLDLVVVAKNDAGEVDVMQPNGLDEDGACAFAGLIGALVGLDTDGQEEMRRNSIAGAPEPEEVRAVDDEAVWYLSDAIPAGSAAAVALIEHRWAVPLRDRIVEAGGFALADEWIHPADLVAAGVAATHGPGTARP